MTSILKVSEIQDPTNGNTAMTIDTSGYVFPKLPHFNFRSSAGQTIAHNTTTVITTFDTATSDTHNFCDTTNKRVQFNSTTAGTYLITYGFKVNGVTAARIGAWIKTDASSNYIGYFETGNCSTYQHQTWTFMNTFSAGDYIYLVVYQDSGGNMTFYDDSTTTMGFPHISGVRVG